MHGAEERAAVCLQPQPHTRIAITTRRQSTSRRSARSRLFADRHSEAKSKQSKGYIVWFISSHVYFFEVLLFITRRK